MSTSPATIDFTNATAAAASGNWVQAGIDAIEGIFSSIGAGRNTADEIVPTQNQVGAALTQINAAIGLSSIAQLQQLLSYTGRIGQQFAGFLETVRRNGGDPRAITGAYQTIFPLIDGTDGQGGVIRPDGGTEGSIQRQIVRLGGVVQPPTLTTGFGSNIASLQTTSQSYPWMPQAGFLPTVAPLSTIYGTPIATVSTGLDPITLIALAAAAFYAFGKRRG